MSDLSDRGLETRGLSLCDSELRVRFQCVMHWYLLSFESKEQVHYRGCGGVKGRMWRGIIRSFFRLYMPLLCFHDEKAVEAEGVVSDDEPSL